MPEVESENQLWLHQFYRKGCPEPVRVKAEAFEWENSSGDSVGLYRDGHLVAIVGEFEIWTAHPLAGQSPDGPSMRFTGEALA